MGTFRTGNEYLTWYGGPKYRQGLFNFPVAIKQKRLLAKALINNMNFLLQLVAFLNVLARIVNEAWEAWPLEFLEYRAWFWNGQFHIFFGI